MFAPFLALALMGASPDVLDAKALVQVIDKTIAEPASTPVLTGQRFHIVLPVGRDKDQTLRAFQSPAHWRYSRSDQILEISIGLGEISAANYDQYEKQGLGSLPPLQTLYFQTLEKRAPLIFRTATLDETRLDAGDQRTAVSYGLAATYTPDGTASDLPTGFRPTMAYRTKLPPSRVDNVTEGMTLELDGEVIDQGGRPNILCGDFVGNVKAESVTGDLPIRIKDKQCFVTARITDAVIRNGTGIVLAKWGGSPP